jgi:hypothetical protein
VKHSGKVDLSGYEGKKTLIEKERRKWEASFSKVLDTGNVTTGDCMEQGWPEYRSLRLVVTIILSFST